MHSLGRDRGKSIIFPGPADFSQQVFVVDQIELASTPADDVGRRNIRFGSRSEFGDDGRE